MLATWLANNWRPLTNADAEPKIKFGKTTEIYNSEVAELHGMIAEIYESLPNKFHNDLETSTVFRNLVSYFLYYTADLIPLPSSFSNSSIQVEGVLFTNFVPVLHQKISAIQPNTTGFCTSAKMCQNFNRC